MFFFQLQALLTAWHWITAWCHQQRSIAWQGFSHHSIPAGNAFIYFVLWSSSNNHWCTFNQMYSFFPSEHWNNTTATKSFPFPLCFKVWTLDIPSTIWQLTAAAQLWSPSLMLWHVHFFVVGLLLAASSSLPFTPCCYPYATICLTTSQKKITINLHYKYLWGGTILFYSTIIITKLSWHWLLWEPEPVYLQSSCMVYGHSFCDDVAK